MPRLSICRALGQILEYSYFSACCRAKQLFIVTDQMPDGKVEDYMQRLDKMTGIPLYYLHFDMDKNNLSEPI